MATRRPRQKEPFTIGGVEVQPGEQLTVEIPLAPTYSHDDLAMSVHVTHGVRPGPTLFVCAAVHGDEINGIEIIRRVIKQVDPRKVAGTLLAIPIVNVYGVISHSRYLPDGRDLNRSFPGSATGSLTGRVADTFMREIVRRSSHGIDLHTGGRHRSNFPQIRAELDDPVVREMTEAFGAPLVIDSKIRDGSLREVATEVGVPVILYEASEALRFDEVYIRAGVKGVLNVMRHIGMLRKSRARTGTKPIVSRATQWLRAPTSGLHRALVPLGAQVEKGQTIGVIADPLGDSETEVTAPISGIVIGRSNLPLTYLGDALFHIAKVSSRTQFEYEEFHEELLPSDSDPGTDPPTEAPIAG
jgi:predicted deacylase